MARKRLPDTFTAAYPNIARWVKDEEGWIELGSDDCSPSFIRVMNCGGMVWEGEQDYATIHDALLAAEAGIAAWWDEDEAVLAPITKTRATKRADSRKSKSVKLTTVESSMLAAVGYDATTRELIAVFNSGQMWRYEGVPRKVFNELLASDSKGSYMRSMVIGMYPEYQA